MLPANSRACGTGLEGGDTATPTVFYKSILAWNGRGWNLTLRDGTIYVFGENAPLQRIQDRNGNIIGVTRASQSFVDTGAFHFPHVRSRTVGQ